MSDSDYGTMWLIGAALIVIAMFAIATVDPAKRRARRHGAAGAGAGHRHATSPAGAAGEVAPRESP